MAKVDLCSGDEECITNLIGFGSLKPSSTAANSTLFSKGYRIISFTHNHPEHTKANNIDVGFASQVNLDFPNASFSIYTGLGDYSTYTAPPLQEECNIEGERIK